MKDAADNWIDRWGLAAVLLIALALRIAMIALRPEELTHDRDAYLGMAQGVAAGRGLCSPGSATPTAFRPPFYPVLIGAMLTVVPMAMAVAVANIAFGLAAVWGTTCLGRALGLGRYSLLAASVVAVDPLLLQYTAQPMTENVCTGLVALMLVSLKGRSECSARRDWLAGVLFGLVVLCRPAFWPLAGLMAVAWCWKAFGNSDCELRTAESKSFTTSASANFSNPQSAIHNPQSPDSPRSRLPNLGGLPWRVAVGALLVVAPWVVRNQMVFGVPLLTTTHGGYTLLLANNPVFYREVVEQPWGTVWSGDSLAFWQRELNERLERDLGTGASEVEQDRHQSQLARRFIVTAPGRFARAVWHRVRSLWSTVPLGEASAGAAGGLIPLVGWYYTLLLIAFLVGMLRVAWHPDRGRWWCLFALVFIVQAVHLVYWTNARMRAPLTPVIALFAVAVIAPRRSETVNEQDPPTGLDPCR